MSEEPKRVFCKDCKHRRSLSEYDPWTGDVYVVWLDKCNAAPEIIPHPINGDEPHYVPCKLRNANLDCTLFELRPINQPAKKPWWRFWS